MARSSERATCIPRPALSRNKPAVLIALAGTVLIAFVAIYLAQGVSRATTVGLAGTLLGLGLIAALAALTTDAAHLSGLVEESTQIIRLSNDNADLSGLLIAVMMLGALGVLTDITVTQAPLGSTSPHGSIGVSGNAG